MTTKLSALKIHQMYYRVIGAGGGPGGSYYPQVGQTAIYPQFNYYDVAEVDAVVSALEAEHERLREKINLISKLSWEWRGRNPQFPVSEIEAILNREQEKQP